MQKKVGATTVAFWGLIFAACASGPPGASNNADASDASAIPPGAEAEMAAPPPAMLLEASEEVTPENADSGFTRFRKSPDTIAFYVSADGDDSNDGTSAQTALRTPDAALERVRDGFPDWILLRRGDSFGALGQLRKSGRSLEEPMLIASYGESTERPRIAGGFSTSGASRGPISTDFLAIVSLHFERDHADPDEADFDPTTSGPLVTWLRGTQGLRIEDSVFRFGAVNIQGPEEAPVVNVVLHRIQVLDTYSTKGHAQGIFSERTKGLKISESLFDHNGWHETLAGADSTIFNHNIYLQNGTLDAEIRDSILMRASSHGMQFRGGGTIVGNFLFRNPISILVGGGTHPEPDGVVGTVRRNVLFEGVNMSSGEGRGGGIDLENIRSAVVEDNIIAACQGSNCRAMTPDVAGVEYVDNTVLGWDNSDSNVSSPVTLLDYAKTLGMQSLDEFYAALRAQSKFNWREELTAPRINAYFRENLAN